MRNWPALVAALTNKLVGRCCHVEIIGKTGIAAHMTSCDQDQVVGSNMYLASPGFDVSRLTVRSGGQPATIDITIPISSTGPLYPNDVKRGAWRGASMTIWLALTSDPTVREIIATGFVGRTNFSEQLEGRVELLTKADVLRDIVLLTMEPKCRYHLYGDRCQVVETPHRHAGTVASAINRRTFTSAVAPTTNFTFNLGKITWISGANIGMQGWIQAWTVGSGLFRMVTDFPFEIQTGDAFYASHGCAQNRTACKQFDNIDRYPGFDFVAIG